MFSSGPFEPAWVCGKCDSDRHQPTVVSLKAHLRRVDMRFNSWLDTSHWYTFGGSFSFLTRVDFVKTDEPPMLEHHPTI